MNRPWSLEDGLELVRGLQADANAFGYHISLGGSVLTTGRSDKDLDLYFLPFDSATMPRARETSLFMWLSKMWGYPEDFDTEDEKVSSSEDENGDGEEIEWADEDVRVRPAEAARDPWRAGQWVADEVAPPPQGIRAADGVGWVVQALNDERQQQQNERAGLNGGWLQADHDRVLMGGQIGGGIPVPTQPQTSPYRRKLKFQRKDDRIDVFIL